jgi:hypothetical protein
MMEKFTYEIDPKEHENQVGNALACKGPEIGDTNKQTHTQTDRQTHRHLPFKIVRYIYIYIYMKEPRDNNLTMNENAKS